MSEPNNALPDDTLDRLLVGKATEGDQLLAYNALRALASSEQGEVVAVGTLVRPYPPGAGVILKAAHPIGATQIIPNENALSLPPGEWPVYAHPPTAATPGFVLAYPGCPAEWQVKPEDMPATQPEQVWEVDEAAVENAFGEACKAAFGRIDPSGYWEWTPTAFEAFKAGWTAALREPRA